MGNQQQPKNFSRRSFLTLGLFKKNNTEPTTTNAGAEMIKMLTPGGKLVEVRKDLVDAAARQKASNQEILNWMDNPSKK